MALKGTFIWLCLLAVWASSAAQDDTLIQDCSGLAHHITAALQAAIQCDTEQTAALLLSMRNLTDALHKHQLKDCQGAQPEQCPNAEVPDNGGLACVTVSNKRYCKPLCNHGYDFAFLRRSRLYDECSEQTGYKWNSQYIGGNKLAVCNKASIQVSGAKTAYFPKDQDCLTTKSSSQLQNRSINDFTTELRSQGIEAESQKACLVCGRL